MEVGTSVFGKVIHKHLPCVQSERVEIVAVLVRSEREQIN